MNSTQYNMDGSINSTILALHNNIDLSAVVIGKHNSVCSSGMYNGIKSVNGNKGK